MKNTRLSMVRPGGGGGSLPSYRLMGMCRWIDYNGVTFSVELLEGVRDKAALVGSYFDFNNHTIKCAYLHDLLSNLSPGAQG